MTSDPRQILAEAGVECGEVDGLESFESISCTGLRRDVFWGPDVEKAILALARLVAKYKWQRNYVIEMFVAPEYGTEWLNWEETDADLDNQWEEHGAG